MNSFFDNTNDRQYIWPPAEPLVICFQAFQKGQGEPEGSPLSAKALERIQEEPAPVRKGTMAATLAFVNDMETPLSRAEFCRRKKSVQKNITRLEAAVGRFQWGTEVAQITFEPLELTSFIRR